MRSHVASVLPQVDAAAEGAARVAGPTLDKPAVRRSADHYQQTAARCRLLANGSSTDAVRRTLYDVASTYDDLARQVVELVDRI